MTFMKIAIIGNGFAGFAAAHYLKPYGEITVFDKEGISASRIAAGLLHKFVGMHAKKNLFADEALQLSLDLILPKTKTGLLRIAQNEEQAEWFKKAARDYPEEVIQRDEKSIWIENAWVVDCPKYLSTLDYIKRDIASLDELQEYDKVVLCTGSAVSELWELPIHKIGGQLLEITGSPAPDTPISGQIYLIPLEDRIIVGSTYERTPQDAVEVLLPKLAEIQPEFKVNEVLTVKKAFRASAPGHLPLVKQLNEKTWAFTGLGSKGLLYHAYYARQLASKMFPS